MSLGLWDGGSLSLSLSLFDPEWSKWGVWPLPRACVDHLFPFLKLTRFTHLGAQLNRVYFSKRRIGKKLSNYLYFFLSLERMDDG